jgi:hypothetical protein
MCGHRSSYKIARLNFSYRSSDHKIREIFLESGCTQLLKNIGNRGEGLPGKKPHFSCPCAIYAFDQNGEIPVGGLDYPDQVFVRLEWISKGTLGLITNLA